MSAIVALDPNVLLAAAADHSDASLAVYELMERADSVAIGLDPDLKIYEEYLRHRDTLTNARITNRFIMMFLDRRSNRNMTAVSVATLSEADWNLIRSVQCDEPVEPSLISVAWKAPEAAGMVVLGETLPALALRRRGTDQSSGIDAAHANFPGLQVWRVKDVYRMLQQLPMRRYPATEADLRLEIDKLLSEEDECYEFKHPGDPDGILKQSLILDALIAACGMVNSIGGRVYIGVTSQGRIEGVKALNQYGDELTNDALQRKLTDQFNRFNPPVNRYIKPGVIRLANGQRVIVLHVYQRDSADRQIYTFDNNEYIAEYNRTGPSTRRTVLGPSGPRRRY
jgi:hypothetical protein